MNNENMVNNQPSEPLTTVNPNNIPVEPVAPIGQPVAPMEQPVPPMGQPVAPMQPSSPNGYEQPKSNKKIIIGIVAVLIVAAIGIGVYFAFFRKVSGKQVVDGTVNKIFQAAINASEEIEKSIVIDFKKDVVQFNGNVKATIETDNQEIQSSLQGLKNASIDYDIRLDLKSLSGSVDLKESENDNSVFNINAFLRDKKLYLKSDALSDSYYIDLTDKVEWDKIDISKLPEYNSGSVSQLLKKIKDVVKASIKDEYITQEDGEYLIDGTTVKGMKTTISLSQQDILDIEKNIMTKIKDDDDILAILSQMTMTDKEEIKSSISQSLESVNNDNTTVKSDEKQDINIYTDNRGKFLGFQLISRVNDQKNGVEAVANGDIVTIKVYNRGQVEYTFNYNTKEKELSFKVEEYSFKIKFSKNGISLTVSYNGIEVKLEFTRDIDGNSETITAKVEGMYDKDGISVRGTLEENTRIEVVSEINTFNTSSSKNLETVSESDQEKIMSELNKVAEKSLIFKIAGASLKETDVYNESHTTIDYPDYNSYIY